VPEMWYMPYLDMLSEWQAIPPTVSSPTSTVTRAEFAYMLWKSSTPTVEPVQVIDRLIRSTSRQDLHIDGVASQANLTPGQTFTYTITVENNGDDEEKIDVRIRVPNGLKITSSTADTKSDTETSWENERIRDGDEKDFQVTIQVLATATAGSLVISADAEDEDSTTTVLIQKTTQAGYETQFGDPVLFWSSIALQANAEDHTGTFGKAEQAGPGASSRALAIVHAAIFDAVNSIDGSYQPYLVKVPVITTQAISMDAAVATAAYRTLLALYPQQKPAFDLALQSHLNLITDQTAKITGTAIGETVAQTILQSRSTDGANLPATYVPSQLPGRHRVDPLNPAQPFMGDRWGSVKPFVLLKSDQFRSPPPPAITSPEYALSYNEVLQYGGDGITTPTIRTADQTNIGIYWAYDGVNRHATAAL
jgi:uncharacterized repeat protein (TIGR01451 family)